MGHAMKTLGTYCEPSKSEHFFEVVFSNPKQLSFLWAHCDLTAGAVSAFAAPFLPAEATGSKLGRDDVCFSVSYVVNELLENAQKFGNGGVVTMRSRIVGNDLLLWASNTASPEAVRNLEGIVSGILQGDPQQLLLERIEHNALHPENSASGLGYLTMMSDYGVRFGWAFHEQSASEALVETQAWLSLERKS